MNFEYLDHTADVLVRCYGKSVEDAFATAGKALFDTITRGAEIGGEEQAEFSVESIDREGLLVGFLSHLLLLHETENLVFHRFEVTLEGETRLLAVCVGGKFDSTRHAEGVPVKGISYHLMEIVDAETDRPAVVQVLFDI